MSVFFIIYSVFYLGYFYREYVSDYNSLGDKIQELENKLSIPVTDQGIEISPFIEFNGYKVGVKIYNSTFENTSKLKVDLIGIHRVPYYDKTTVLRHSLLHHFELTNRSFKSGERLNKDGGIDKQDYVIMYLADVQDNLVVFLLEKPWTVQDYENQSENNESINSRKQLEPSYTGYHNVTTDFEIDLLIQTEKTNGQLIQKQFKGEVIFLEMIRQWIHWHDKWTKMADKPVADISLDIVEVKNNPKNMVFLEHAT